MRRDLVKLDPADERLVRNALEAFEPGGAEVAVGVEGLSRRAAAGFAMRPKKSWIGRQRSRFQDSGESRQR
jgi:hypothetical protein